MVSTFGSCAYPGVDLVWNQVAQDLRDCRKVTLKPLHELTKHLWRSKLVNVLHLQTQDVAKDVVLAEVHSQSGHKIGQLLMYKLSSV